MIDENGQNKVVNDSKYPENFGRQCAIELGVATTPGGRGEGTLPSN